MTLRLKRKTTFIALAIAFTFFNTSHAQDATSRKIVEIGTQDPQAMTWLDILTNRFGGRMTGSDAFTHAAKWTRDQLTQWGVQAELEEAGQVPVGFNRGPWFGKVVSPTEKTLRFGTPSFTSGTKGVQRGPAVLGPENEADAQTRMAEFKGAWVFIKGESRGMGRDGRREYKPDAITLKLMEAGALGTIQSAREPIALLDGVQMSWDKLPTMPDIKLTASQYTEIQEQLKKGEKVELEFDIRNWFYPGPVAFHNIVGIIPGTAQPDEYILIDAHMDSFDSATGAVDDGSGISPTIEAMRLLAKAGAKPRRSIVMLGTGGEEIGIRGAAAYTERHAKIMDKVVMMINRDGSPGAISGITVPSAWKPAFDRVASSLQGTEFGFEVKTSDYPRIQSEAITGTDSSAFSLKGVPTPLPANKSDFNYSRTWHTLLDTYNEVVPYAKAQQHSAIAIALMAYEAANAPEKMTRDGYYLPKGLYVELNSTPGNILVKLESDAAPAAIARLVGQLESRFRPPAFGPGTPPPTTPPAAIGSVKVSDGKFAFVFNGTWPETALPEQPIRPLANAKAVNVAINAQGHILVNAGNTMPDGYTAIGTIVAGNEHIGKLEANQELKQVRVIRAGAEAKAFLGEGQEKK